MIVLDTTVLVYAVGAAHPLAEPCAGLLRAVGAGAVRATTTAEVIQEFVHVRARRRNRREAVGLGRDFAVAFAPLVTVGDEDLMAGLALYEDSSRLGAFDAVLAAVARRAGGRLASADGAFRGIDGLEHLDPASPSFLDRLTE